MSVLLTSDTYINGVLTTSGTTVSLGYIPEYNLVYEGSGTWVSIPNVVPDSAHNESVWQLASAASYTPIANSKLRFVASGTWFNSTADTIAGTADQRRETRQPMYLGGKDCTEIRLVYGNYWLDLGAAGRETNTGNAVELTAALEYNGTTIQAKFNGSYLRTMADGEALVVSDPIYPSAFSLSTFPANANIFVRTSLAAQVGQKLPRSYAYMSVSPASKIQSVYGSTQLLGTGLMTGTVSNGGGPLAVIGKTVLPELSILAIGDSTVVGNNDVNDIYGSAGGGYFHRGMYQVNGRNIPHANHARNGGTLAQYQTYGIRRQQLYQYASHVYVGFGTNDLFRSAGNPVYTSFETAYTNEIALIRSCGAKVITGYVGVRTDSTDTWITTANQTQQANWTPSDITTVNSYLNTAGDYWYDPAADFRDSVDNTKWAVNGTANYATSDGTHPSPTVIALAAARLKTLASALIPVL
jgi:lysophospholipase L1-like esterase